MPAHVRCIFRGEVFHALRVRAGITQTDLADDSGVSQSTICRIERGTVDVDPGSFGQALGPLALTPALFEAQCARVDRFLRVVAGRAIPERLGPWWARIAGVVDDRNFDAAARGLITFATMQMLQREEARRARA